MTTREIYYKTYIESELPVVRMNFICKENNIIQIGNWIPIQFNEEDHESNILKMEEIEKRDGFMYWINTPEGEELLNEACSALAKSYSKLFNDINNEDQDY